MHVLCMCWTSDMCVKMVFIEWGVGGEIMCMLLIQMYPIVIRNTCRCLNGVGELNYSTV